MYCEPGVPHKEAHFHAYYQGKAAVFSIDPIGLIAGDMGLRQRRLVEAWAELHQEELAKDWELLQEGRAAKAIEPLH